MQRLNAFAVDASVAGCAARAGCERQEPKSASPAAWSSGRYHTHPARRLRRDCPRAVPTEKIFRLLTIASHSARGRGNLNEVGKLILGQRLSEKLEVQGCGQRLARSSQHQSSHPGLELTRRSTAPPALALRAPNELGYRETLFEKTVGQPGELPHAATPLLSCCYFANLSFSAPI